MSMFSSRGSAKKNLCRITVLALSVNAICSYGANSQTKSDKSQKQSDTDTSTHLESQKEPWLTVTAARLATTISAEDMQKKGANDFGSVMRYQTLVGATGVSAGSGAGKSGFDRAGYTGYNVRGLESNRVGIDVDGVALPEATGRSYAGRKGVNTFGIGRDYIDPYMFSMVDIEPGATAVSQPNTSIGGVVSFHTKSPDDYNLSQDKLSYFGYQSDYDSSNRSWHNGLTTAAGDEKLRAIFVLSRRDGQQTRNNSGEVAAYPQNWHSTAFLTTGIWQPNDTHKLSASFDYYDKAVHSHYDAWDMSGMNVLGTAYQQSKTRRFAGSLADEYIPYNDYIDTLTTQLYWQKTQAHDNTLLPYATGLKERVLSDYNTDSYGSSVRLVKALGRHEISGGLNASLSNTHRPFKQLPAPLAYYAIMQPEADSRTIAFGGFVQDKMRFDVSGHNFEVIPGVRAAYQKTKPRNLAQLTRGSALLSDQDVNKLYGAANSDTQLLPSLLLQYSVNSSLFTYVQYKRGVQFPNASQLYGSWGLGSNYAGPGQYALIGNTDLKSETSNNFEWGLKGQITQGVTFNSALFYNNYKNFIAYNRYSRRATPDQFTDVPGHIYTVYRAENRDKAFIYGGEISTKVNFGTWFKSVDGLSASAALGYSKGESKSKLSGDKYVDLDSVAPMKAVVGVAWDDISELYGAAVTTTFVKGKQASETTRDSTNSGRASAKESNFIRVPGYSLIDMTAYWRVAKNVKLSGGIYNITDRKYWDYLSSRELIDDNAQNRNDIALAVMPGRTFQLGLNVDF